MSKSIIKRNKNNKSTRGKLPIASHKRENTKELCLKCLKGLVDYDTNDRYCKLCYMNVEQEVFDRIRKEEKIK